MKTTCIIVDDEPLARSAIRAILSRFDNIAVEAECEDSFEALKILQQKKIDLMFLDIQMPEVSGLDFLRSLRQAPAVILTTAYKQYAIEGYELDVVDYLLKPVSADRMMKALDKFYHRQHTGVSNVTLHEAADDSTMTIRSNRKNIVINYHDILYIMSMKDYIQIFTQEQKYITQMAIGELESQLPAGKFLRIHRSYIVNLSKVTAFTSMDVEIGKVELPIGRSYQGLVFNTLKDKIT